MAKPSILSINKQRFDVSQMELDGQLSLDAEEHEFPFGSSKDTTNTDFLVRTPLSERTGAMMFAANTKSAPKIIACVGTAGTGKTETLKDFSKVSG